MALVAKKRVRAAPVMNVTPLVDVVLVLLIIFMVVIPAMEKSPHIALPDIFNPDPEAKGKTDPFTLSITPTGEMFFEKEQVTEANLEKMLRDAQENEPGRRLVLRADRTANYVDVRKLFKIVQAIGFPGVSMRVNSLKQDDEK